MTMGAGPRAINWMRAVARDGARRALDAVLPPLCLACGALVAEQGGLCPACWGNIQFLAPPFCDACGHPFEVDPGGPHPLCGACLAAPPPWGRARAVFHYDDASRGLVLRFKHGDRLEGAPAFARWMARAAGPLLDGCDLVAAVPLHRWRLWSRRYNQAAVLALALAAQAGLNARPDVLVRVRSTAPQGHLGRDERAGNVRGAFAVKPGAPVAGCNILLVDDVLTTGATLRECTRVLLRAGAARVDVVTLARVVLAP